MRPMPSACPASTCAQSYVSPVTLLLYTLDPDSLLTIRPIANLSNSFVADFPVRRLLSLTSVSFLPAGCSALRKAVEDFAYFSGLYTGNGGSGEAAIGSLGSLVWVLILFSDGLGARKLATEGACGA